MKLFYSPGACSLAIHVLLEEIGKPYETTLVSMRDGSNRKPDYLALNPKGKVPALLRDDGSVLTQVPAIAVWLARTNPEAKLLPADPDAESRALETLDYICSYIHMQGFTRISRPGNFTPNEADHDAVQARGRAMFAEGMSVLDAGLKGRDYVAGGAFSIADAGLIFVENWAGRAEYVLPANLAAHFARMKTRPAVQHVFASEGLSL